MMRRLLCEELGQTLIEYGLLTSLISVVSISMLTVLGRKTRDVYVTVNDSLVTAGGGGGGIAIPGGGGGGPKGP